MNEYERRMEERIRGEGRKMDGNGVDEVGLNEGKRRANGSIGSASLFLVHSIPAPLTLPSPHRLCAQNFFEEKKKGGA